EYEAQGVRPRVWFGERWITSMFDLFEENVRLFPALIPESREMAEEPLLTEGSSPRLHELMLHNGTVWRWNRPIYDPGIDVPHLRLENRLLPAGPTPADMVANAAFFYGILHSLVHERRPLWSRMSFEQATEAFQQCARWGLEARALAQGGPGAGGGSPARAPDPAGHGGAAEPRGGGRRGRALRRHPLRTRPYRPQRRPLADRHRHLARGARRRPARGARGDDQALPRRGGRS